MMQMIFGLIMSVVCAGCATVLIWKWLQIKSAREKHDRDAIRTQTENIIHDNFRIAFEEEYARRKDAEFRLKITQRELKRAREQMSMIKLAEVQK